MRQILLVAFFLCPVVSAQENSAAPQAVVIEKFDPKRDAALDIEHAIANAKTTGKRILLDVGGEWCSWCHRLDTLFMKHADLREYMHSQYVVVKVNFSKENKNEAVLGKYPAIQGYPHIFILDSDGKLLRSQETGELEEGKGHSKEKVFAFLKKWAPVEKGIREAPAPTRRPASPKRGEQGERHGRE